MCVLSKYWTQGSSRAPPAIGRAWRVMSAASPLSPRAPSRAFVCSAYLRVLAVGSSTYRETWTKVFSEKTAVIPDLTVNFMTLVAGLAYSIILGDMFSGVAKLLGLPAVLTLPNVWIGLLSAVVLLPLSLMKDLSSLAVGSIVGTAGTVYTMLFIFLRLFDGSYALGGKFHTAIDATLRPSFAAAGAAKPLFNPGMFVLLSMLSSAFLCAALLRLKPWSFDCSRARNRH